jgi:RNA-dependent RNA polymerase
LKSDLKKIIKRPDETIIEGDVLVTKNPCSHPGDIQKVRAVNRPELKHLFNVVVYSSLGERPQQHKLSMGDLDGDTYFVTWDREIVGGFNENYPPGQNSK